MFKKNNPLICLEKAINTYLKAKNSLHTTQISSFIYVFIIFLQKKQMLKYTIYVCYSEYLIHFSIFNNLRDTAHPKIMFFAKDLTIFRF